ncbi:Glyoxalase/Bleomycin resistance protein/Dihydroxybiphenyl dioxygenase, partial [Periconia macrospinosa]
MKLSTILPSLILAFPVLSCDHANIARRASENSTIPLKNFIPGDDPPANPATMGYFINHIALQVSNVTRSREWYSNVLGMRHIFTVEISPNFTITYMGHSQGGRNGTGYQTGGELLRDKNNLAGLVELQHNPNFANRVYNAENPHNSFSHLGLIVPDIAATQAHLESQGVRIIKKTGELDLSGATEESRIVGGMLGVADLKSVRGDIQAAIPSIKFIGFDLFIVAADPDGNLFEIQPQ